MSRMNTTTWAQKRASARPRMQISDDLRESNINGLDVKLIITLGENGIKTLDQLADLASDELLEIIKSDTISIDQANEIIMKAREHWFEDENADADTKITDVKAADTTT